MNANAHDAANAKRANTRARGGGTALGDWGLGQSALAIQSDQENET
jgi:hypothetical protein